MSEYGLDLTPDGIGDEVTEDFKMALLIAARLAEKVVERIAQQHRDAERQAEEHARAGREQMEAHRALARAASRDVGTDRWWEGAGPAEVARAWQMARPWEEHDPELARTTQDLREGLGSRYGVPDPDGLDAADLPGHLADRVAQARGAQARQAHPETREPMNEAEWRAQELTRYAEELRGMREQLDADHGPGGAEGHPVSRVWVTGQEAGTSEPVWLHERREVLTDLEDRARGAAARATSEADRLRGHGQEQRQSVGADYDTPQRREELRAALNGRGVYPEAVEARVLSDVAQGRPPVDAVAQDRATARTARTRSRGRRLDRQRDADVGR